MSEAAGARAGTGFAQTATECAACSRPLAGFYYDANGAAVCEACRYQIEAGQSEGSPGGRALRAIVAGLAAAVAGSLLYYAVGALTGYEFALIAILVGWAVGGAVRWGSHRRGGLPYQALAVALTYFAIVSTYIPPILKELHDAQAAEAAAEDPAGGGATAQATASANAADVPHAAGILFGLVLLLVIASTAPVLAGVQNIIGMVIIAVGLYEAWRLNKRAVLTITGPHTLRTVST